MGRKTKMRKEGGSKISSGGSVKKKSSLQRPATTKTKTKTTKERLLPVIEEHSYDEVGTKHEGSLVPSDMMSIRKNNNEKNGDNEDNDGTNDEIDGTSIYQSNDESCSYMEITVAEGEADCQGAEGEAVSGDVEGDCVSYFEENTICSASVPEDHQTNSNYQHQHQRPKLNRRAPPVKRVTSFYLSVPVVNSLDDDEMTQITTDWDFSTRSCNRDDSSLHHQSRLNPLEQEWVPTVSPSPERIKQILRNDLTNSDDGIVWGAMDELRLIVAAGGRSRRELVQLGGVMNITGAME